MLEEKAKPLKQIPGYENGLNLPKHMAEHIYMFTGESVRSKFKAKNYIIDQIIDWFGKDVEITPEDDGECIVKVKVNKEALFHWSLQYGIHIEILEPLELRQKVIDAVKTIGEKYSGN